MFIILEGLDRSGKSTVADWYRSQGFEYVHMLAPNKKFSQPGYTGPSYLDECVEMYVQYANKDVIFDRSVYGEIIWSKVFGRKPQLSEDDIEVLREIEDQNQAKRILMVDPNVEAHWKRCVDNNEPLNKQQFVAARTLYSNMAHTYSFDILDLPTFLSEKGQSLPSKAEKVDAAKPEPAAPTPPEQKPVVSDKSKFTPEQERLLRANAINSILSKPLLKNREWPYNELEDDVKKYLNVRLGELLGGQASPSLTSEDVAIVKEFVNRLKERQSTKG